MNIFFNYFRANSIILVLLSLVVPTQFIGCAKLLKPRIKTELVALKSGDYQLDQAHASLVFKVDHMGFSKFVGRFNQFDASLNFDPKVPEQTKLNAIINMDSIDLVDDDFETVLQGRKWFNTAVYPQAEFSTSEVVSIKGNTLIFSGMLTFLGVTKPINIEVNFNGGATNMLTQKYTLGFSAKASFLRSDFGLTRYIPTVGDAIDIEVHAEFQKQ